MLAALAMLWLAACSRNYESADVAAPVRAGANRTLAYEHTVRVDANENEVRKTYEDTVAACTSSPNASCTVLEARLGTGRHVSAEVKMRGTPDAVRALMARLGRHGEVTSVRTSATDLAMPIADAERTAAKLASYRDKLEALMARAANDIDALIKIQRELADVQAKLDEIASERAVLDRRVQFEVLTVEIESDRQRSFWQPVRDALDGFGADLSHAIAGLVSGMAYVIPWAVVLFGAWRGLRWWRRRRTRATAG